MMHQSRQHKFMLTLHFVKIYLSSMAHPISLLKRLSFSKWPMKPGSLSPVQILKQDKPLSRPYLHPACVNGCWVYPAGTVRIDSGIVTVTDSMIPIHFD